MPEKYPPLAIAPSGSVRHVLHQQQLRLAGDTAAFIGLASFVGVPIPAEPRVVLLHEGEFPHTREYVLFAEDAGKLDVPTYDSDHDLIVRLPRTFITDELLTQGVTRTLAAGRRARNTANLTKLGAGARAIGIGGGGALSFTLGDRYPWVEPAAGALFLGGAGLIAYAHNRRQPRTPNVHGKSPPIWTLRQSSEPASD